MSGAAKEEELATVETPVVVGAVTVPLSQWNALKQFSFDVLSTYYDNASGLDGSEIENLGEEAGLVIDHVVTEDDCAEWRDFGVGETINRVVPWLHDANCDCTARVTADAPSTLGAGGSLDEDLLSERNRLREALVKYDAFVRDLCGDDFPSDIDGGTLQEMLVEHGLYRVEPFDPAKHNDWSGVAETGDDFYVPNHVAREALGAK